MSKLVTSILLCLLLLFTTTAFASSKIDGPGFNTALMEQYIGGTNKGAYDPKDKTYKILIPRNDLDITINGIKMVAGMGLTSWVMFKKIDPDNLVMKGNLVLTEDQINPIIKVAIDNNLDVIELHNHLLWESPKVMFMHIEGIGTPKKLAEALQKVFQKIHETKDGSGDFPIGEMDVSETTLNTHQIETILGAKGKMVEGVFKVIIDKKAKPNADDDDQAYISRTNTSAVFAGSDDAAVLDGDLAMQEPNLQRVLAALYKANISIVAIHERMVDAKTRIIFLHYWGIGKPAEMAHGLRSALDVSQEQLADNTIANRMLWNTPLQADAKPPAAVQKIENQIVTVTEHNANLYMQFKERFPIPIPPQVVIHRAPGELVSPIVWNLPVLHSVQNQWHTWGINKPLDEVMARMGKTPHERFSKNVVPVINWRVPMLYGFENRLHREEAEDLQLAQIRQITNTVFGALSKIPTYSVPMRKPLVALAQPALQSIKHYNWNLWSLRPLDQIIVVQKTVTAPALPQLLPAANSSTRLGMQRNRLRTALERIFMPKAGGEVVSRVVWNIPAVNRLESYWHTWTVHRPEVTDEVATKTITDKPITTSRLRAALIRMFAPKAAEVTSTIVWNIPAIHGIQTYWHEGFEKRLAENAQLASPSVVVTASRDKLRAALTRMFNPKASGEVHSRIVWNIPALHGIQTVWHQGIEQRLAANRVDIVPVLVATRALAVDKTEKLHIAMTRLFKPKASGEVLSAIVWNIPALHRVQNHWHGIENHLVENRIALAEIAAAKFAKAHVPVTPTAAPVVVATAVPQKQPSHWRLAFARLFAKRTLNSELPVLRWRIPMQYGFQQNWKTAEPVIMALIHGNRPAYTFVANADQFNAMSKIIAFNAAPTTKGMVVFHKAALQGIKHYDWNLWSIGQAEDQSVVVEATPSPQHELHEATVTPKPQHVSRADVPLMTWRVPMLYGFQRDWNRAQPVRVTQAKVPTEKFIKRIQAAFSRGSMPLMIWYKKPVLTAAAPQVKPQVARNVELKVEHHSVPPVTRTVSTTKFRMRMQTALNRILTPKVTGEVVSPIVWNIPALRRIQNHWHTWNTTRPAEPFAATALGQQFTKLHTALVKVFSRPLDYSQQPVMKWRVPVQFGFQRDWSSQKPAATIITQAKPQPTTQPSKLRSAMTKLFGKAKTQLSENVPVIRWRVPMLFGFQERLATLPKHVENTIAQAKPQPVIHHTIAKPQPATHDATAKIPLTIPHIVVSSRKHHWYFNT